MVLVVHPRVQFAFKIVNPIKKIPIVKIGVQIRLRDAVSRGWQKTILKFNVKLKELSYEKVSEQKYIEYAPLHLIQ